MAAPIADVWAAWTEPARLNEWLPTRVEGSVAVGETLQLVGETFGLVQLFEFKEIKPSTRLLLRGGAPDTAAQKLEVGFKEAGERSTLVRLVHSGFGSGVAARDERDRTASAWQTLMAVLRVYAEQFFARPRESFARFADADVTYEELFAYYTEADFTRRWLTEGGSIGAVGEPCELILRGGLRLSGELLSRFPSRAVAMACREIGGVLVLSALPSGKPGRAGRAGAWVSTWEPDNPNMARLKGELASAVDRLVAALAATPDEATEL